MTGNNIPIRDLLEALGVDMQGSLAGIDICITAANGGREIGRIVGKAHGLEGVSGLAVLVEDNNKLRVLTIHKTL